MLTVAQEAPPKAKTFPIIEIFGPTIQGEGAEAGLPTHFVRLGGCDYRCSWCDTMYAVDPVVVRRDSTLVEPPSQIIETLTRLPGSPRWVSVSGGNPPLHRLATLGGRRHERAFLVSVETQGSVWRGWLSAADRLTASPKPPSSGMATARVTSDSSSVHGFGTSNSSACIRAILKIVCFEDRDVVWAKRIAARHPDVPLFLSAGDADRGQRSCPRLAWRVVSVAVRTCSPAIRSLHDVRVLPQNACDRMEAGERRMTPSGCSTRASDCCGTPQPSAEDHHRSSRSSRLRPRIGSRFVPEEPQVRVAYTATASESRFTSEARSIQDRLDH